MKCHDPYTDIGGAFACGRCPACLSGRRRTWAHRIMLEAMQHEKRSAFVTLTYSEEKVPTTAKGRATLEIEHMRLFFKRLRREVAPQKVRYFAVGEYGDNSERPHYHIALFGLGSCDGGPVSVFLKSGKINRVCLCKICCTVRDTWGFGHIMCGTLTSQSAMYVAGYVVKKMTHLLDPRLDGRFPEFARMSLKPGIGAFNLAPVVRSLRGSKMVPSALRHGQVLRPLGRYVRREIAKKMVGQDKDFIRAALGSAEGQKKVLDGMRVLRAYASENNLSVSEVFTELNGGRWAAPKKGGL